MELKPFEIGKLALWSAARFRRRCGFREVQLDVVFVPQVPDVRIFGQLILLVWSQFGSPPSIRDGIAGSHHGHDDADRNEQSRSNWRGHNGANQPLGWWGLAAGARRRLIRRDSSWLVVITLQSIWKEGNRHIANTNTKATISFQRYNPRLITIPLWVCVSLSLVGA